MRFLSIKNIFIALSVSVAFASCDSILDVPSNSLESDDAVYSNVDKTNMAIASIYDVIGENNSYRNRLWIQMGGNNDIEYRIATDLKADNMISLYNTNVTMGEGYNNTDDSNPWSRIYKGIERANLAISGIRKYGNPKAGNDMGHFLGEALTLRAFYYNDLAKWWGDVPARFEPVSQGTIYLPKSDRDVIYDQIIKDLQEASELMYGPDQKFTLSTKRLSKDAARGLLARVALTAAGYSMRPAGTSDAEVKVTATAQRQTELYTIAREACRAIITDGNYKLADNFRDIFYDQCQDVDSHHREAIWQLPYFYGSRGQMVRYFGLPRDVDGKNTVAIGGMYKIVPTFFYDYDSHDTRRDITVVPYKVSKSSVTGVTVEQSLSSGITGFNLGKWRSEWMKSPIRGNDDGVSPIVIRYADVLLMFAEADLFLGGNEGAEYFNEVRRRAFGVNTHTPSAYDLPLTLDNIKAERGFEFAGENIRKYDLMRWGMLKSAIDKAYENMKNLRDLAGKYADVPQTIYYKNDDSQLAATGERAIKIYGLNRGETEDKTITEPNAGWIKKTWVQALSSTTQEPVLNEVIGKMYVGNPDKRQLLPIMKSILDVSNNVLSNDYGY